MVVKYVLIYFKNGFELFIMFDSISFWQKKKLFCIVGNLSLENIISYSEILKYNKNYYYNLKKIIFFYYLSLVPCLFKCQLKFLK